MTVTDFITKWVGKEADWDKFYSGQCTDLFRYYCDEVLNISQPAGVWGAANFWSNFESDSILKTNFTKVLNNADFTPQEGDVMIWNFNAGGGYGHISICTGENTGTQYFHSFDQNWTRVSYCEIVNHGYKNVYGVLRPKQIMQSNQEELSKMRLERDKNWDLYQDEIKKSKGLQEQIERFKADVANYKTEADSRKKENQKFIEELAKKLYLPATSDQSDIVAGVERLLTVEDQLNDANKTISKEQQKHETEKSEMQKEIDVLKAEIEAERQKRDETEKKLLGRIESLENRLNETESSSDATNEWKEFIDKLLSIFKRR